jgi:hypothetical protein
MTDFRFYYCFLKLNNALYIDNDFAHLLVRLHIFMGPLHLIKFKHLINYRR